MSDIDYSLLALDYIELATDALSNLCYDRSHNQVILLEGQAKLRRAYDELARLPSSDELSSQADWGRARKEKEWHDYLAMEAEQETPDPRANIGPDNWNPEGAT